MEKNQESASTAVPKSASAAELAVKASKAVEAADKKELQNYRDNANAAKQAPPIAVGPKEISLGRISMSESEFPGDTAEHFEALITDVIANARQRGKISISTSKLDGIVTSQLIITGYFD